MPILPDKPPAAQAVSDPAVTRAGMRTFIDLTSKRFGKLIAFRRDGSDARGEAVFLCVCDCGNSRRVLSSALRSGRTTSCGCEQLSGNGRKQSRTGRAAQAERGQTAHESIATPKGKGEVVPTTPKKAKKSRIKFEVLDDTRKGTLLYIAVEDLVVPDQGELGYQRQAIAGHAAYIAANFDWRLFGAIIVVRRLDLDGRLEVPDGGNRLHAVRMRGDIASVPCIVHVTNTVEEAAAIFTGINVYRRSIAFPSLHKAMLLAQDRTHQLAQEALDQLNLNGNIFKSAKSILKFCRKSNKHEAMFRVIPTLRELAFTFPKERISVDFFKGLVTLEIKLAPQGLSVCEPRYVRKMKKLGLQTLTDFAGLGVVFGRHPLMFAKVLASPQRLNIRPNPFVENKKQG
jgi:hypothetical protein